MNAVERRNLEYLLEFAVEEEDRTWLFGVIGTYWGPLPDSVVSRIAWIRARIARQRRMA